jgi:alkylhydroperoxidase/carboxymuconolactone decarboxylase family protein YurZ
MADYRERLRRLALCDTEFIDSVLASQRDRVEACALDPKTHALVRLGALLGADAAPVCAHCTATAAMAAGATPDEVVGTLLAVAPIIGLARAVSAASEIALPIGYDIDAALEALDGSSP